MADHKIEDELKAEERITSGEAEEAGSDDEMILSVRPLQRAPRPRGVLAE